MNNLWILLDNAKVAQLISLSFRKRRFNSQVITVDMLPNDFKNCNIFLLDSNNLNFLIKKNIYHKLKNSNFYCYIILFYDLNSNDFNKNFENDYVDKIVFSPVDLNELERDINQNLLLNNLYTNESKNFIFEEKTIMEQIRLNFELLNSNLLDNNVNVNYFNYDVFLNYYKNNNFSLIIEFIEDFFEIFLLIDTSTYETTIEMVKGIILYISFLQNVDQGNLRRLMNLNLFYEAYHKFINLEMHDALPKYINLSKYYGKSLNNKMLIRSKASLITSYSYVGMFDKSIKNFNEFISYEYESESEKALHDKHKLFILNRYAKTLILLNSKDEYDKFLQYFALQNINFIENNAYFENIYFTLKLYYTIYFEEIEKTTMLAERLLNEFLRDSRSQKSRLNMEILFDSYLISGNLSKYNYILQNFSLYYTFYKKEYFLSVFTTALANYYILEGNIDRARLIFQNYSKILAYPHLNSIVWMELFTKYINYLLLIGEYERFNTLSKKLISDSISCGVTGIKLFFLLELKIHYSVTRKEIYYDLIPLKLINSLESSPHTFEVFTTSYIVLMAKVNDSGLNKFLFNKLITLYYSACEHKQIYIAKTIILSLYELILNQVFENTNTFAFIVELTKTFEQTNYLFKEFNIYYDYLRALNIILLSTTFTGSKNESEIESIEKSFKEKRISFFLENIGKYKEKLLKASDYDKYKMTNEKVNSEKGASEEVKIYLETFKNFFKHTHDSDLGVYEIAILTLLSNSEERTRTEISLELNIKTSSIRYNINKLIEIGLIDFEPAKKSKKNIGSSSHYYFITEKGRKVLNEVFTIEK